MTFQRSTSTWSRTLLLALTSSCAPLVTRTAPPLPSNSPVATSRAATGQGVAAPPDLVTVVPLLQPAWADHKGYVLVEAEVDGHRGTFVLDTGSPPSQLNGRYLRPTPTGGFDTVAAGVKGLKNDEVVHVTIHTLRIGTILVHLDSIDRGPPVPFPTNTNATVTGLGMPYLLGNLGLNTMEPFETIIDYVHHRLVLIRLDAAGRRLASVPEYTPIGTVPLVPVGLGGSDSTQFFYWGIAGRMGGMMDSLLIDSGSPGNDEVPAPSQQAADQLRQALAAGQILGPTPASVVVEHTSDALGCGVAKMLCYGFLYRLGVVGFNLRTRQLILY